LGNIQEYFYMQATGELLPVKNNHRTRFYYHKEQVNQS